MAKLSAAELLGGWNTQNKQFYEVDKFTGQGRARAYLEMLAYKDNEKRIAAYVTSHLAPPDTEEGKGWYPSKNYNYIPNFTGAFDYLTIKEDEEAEAREKEAKATTSAFEGNPKDKRSAEQTAEKDSQVRVRQGKSTLAVQSFSPKVEFFFPNSDGSYPSGATFTLTRTGAAADTALIGYSWSESAESFINSFSIEIVNETVVLNGKTTMLFDAIPLRSVVKIFEDSATKPAFLGILRDKSASATMGSGGVRRTFSLSGDGIMAAVAEFEIFPASLTVGSSPGLQSDFAADLAQACKTDDGGWSILDYVKKLWDLYNEASADASNQTESTTGLAQIVSAFLDTNFFEVSGHNLKMQYPLVPTLNPDAANSFNEALNRSFPKPYYRVWAKTDDNGKVKLRINPAPFIPTDWNQLPSYTIAPIRLISYQLEQTNRDVYTIFRTYCTHGLEMSQMAAMADGGYESRDEERAKFYGVRILNLELLYQDVTEHDKQNEEDGTKTQNTLFKTMYEGMERYWEGTVTLVCSATRNDEGKSENPRAGSRINLLGGTFFVKAASHLWRYGGTPTIRLTVERGAKYDTDGNPKELTGLGTMEAEAL